MLLSVRVISVFREEGNLGCDNDNENTLQGKQNCEKIYMNNTVNSTRRGERKKKDEEEKNRICKFMKT